MHKILFEQEQLPTEPILDTRISVGAFFDRFKELQIPILASQDPYVQAVIKTASIREYIDLSREDLPAMLSVIINAGFPIDTAFILSTQISPHERIEN